MSERATYQISAPGFVGRDDELAALSTVLEAPPTVVLVEGEAGIGKTRLVREYLVGLGRNGGPALVGCCPPLRQPQTLGPVVDAVRQVTGDVRGLSVSGLAGALRPLFPEWASDLPPAPEPAEDATAARYRLFAALGELIERLHASLLVLEDAHWADEATLEFLVFLGSRQRPPISLVITCRPEDTPATSLVPQLARLATGSNGQRLTLGPLDAAQTAALMSSMLAGEAVSEEFAAFIHKHTEGVPLAVEELVRLMADRADLADRGSGWRRVEQITVPATIRDAVLERAARLGADTRTVLRAIAVLSDPADEATIQVMTGLSADRLRAALSHALDSRLLAEDSAGLVSFRHVLAARAIYETINGPHRRILHLRAGQVLEGTSPRSPARLARHFHEAGETGKWCVYAEQAADLALSTADEAAAHRLLHDLLSGARLPAAEVARLLSKIPTTSLTGRGHAQELLAIINDVLGNRGLAAADEGRLRFQAGRLLGAMEDYVASAEQLQRAVRKLPSGSPEATRAMLQLGWPRGDAWRASKHRAWLRRAAAAPVPPGQAVRLDLAVNRVTALLLLGEPEGWDEAAQIPDDAPTVAERRQVARGQLNIANAAMLWGRYPEARRRLSWARELADRGQHLRTLANVAATELHLDWLTGAWDGLAERVASLASHEDLPPATRLETVLVSGQLDAAARVSSTAADRLRLVCTGMRKSGAIELAAESAAALARLALNDGDAETAVIVTDELSEIVARKDIWIWAADLAPARVGALAAAGRIEEAAGLAKAFARGLRGRDAPASKAGLAMCRAVMAGARGEHVHAAVLYGRAANAWHVLLRPYDELLARERQARCLLASGEYDAGLAVLAEAERDLSRLGATGDADRIAQSLRAQGVTVPRVWRRGRHGYGSQLSPREREVVQFVVDGRTNREIAAALHRSPRTVAGQLSSAMRKLGVNSRTALAASATRTGLASGGRPEPVGDTRAEPPARSKN